MLFVGREGETAALAAALSQGANAIVEGRFGMGRTALLRRLQAIQGEAWQVAFADCDLPPASICAQWWSELGGGAAPPPPPGLAALRAALLRAPLADRRPHVLVLDGISRLTPAKLDLVRRFAASGRFRLAAIVETALSRPERVRLAAWLAPARRVALRALPPADRRLFFSRLAAEHRLAWSPAVISGLARSSGGYPLRMQEQARRELARRPAGLELRLAPPP
jgi:hypothetical protein